MRLHGGHPRIEAALDDHFVHSIRASLKRIFPNPYFFDEIFASFPLPVLKWSHAENHLSILLLCKHRLNISKFFYDMIHRWLVPGRRLDVSFFFSADFKLPDFGEDLYTLAEMVIRLEEEDDLEQIEQNLRIIETEVRLGMVSVYHASRILEIHGLSSGEKTSVIQEKISSLVQRRPEEIDYDIFGEMQHFFVMSKDEFKNPREPEHLTRLIAIFYLFRKALERDVETSPEKRHIRLKASLAKVHLPWGVKRVLGVCVGLNFLRANEIFEERHFVKALQTSIPGVRAVSDSFFVNESGQIHTLYIEVEKEDGSDFSLEQMKNLRRTLPDDLKYSIEVALKPLFMPRNEEEVIRNVVTLAGQLRFVRDLPQIILSFEEQTEQELSYTVMLVRILFPGIPSIQQLFEQKESFLSYTPDRVKRIGMLRKKYPKEATVFRVKFSSAPFLRGDQSVDLYKARQAVVAELQKVVGEIRDYNGGMIMKQLELLKALKCLLGELSPQEELLLENFFHSLFPIEMRSVLQPEPLKTLFQMWRQNLSDEVRVEDGTIFVMTQRDIGSSIDDLQIPEMQLVAAKLQTFEEKFQGYIYFPEDEAVGRAFIQVVSKSPVSIL